MDKCVRKGSDKIYLSWEHYVANYERVMNCINKLKVQIGQLFGTAGYNC